MALTSLVVCADESTSQLLRHILENLGISVEHSKTGTEAQARLNHRHFDSVLIDCENEAEATEVVRAARASSRHRSTLAVAIARKESNVRQMFAVGINFVLYKPVSEDRAWSSLRAARSLMKRERRHSGRLPVHSQAALNYANVENAPATLIDLSEEGTAVQSKRNLPPDCKVYFQFALPGQTTLIRLSGEVVWQDAGGRVGMKFVSVPTSSRRLLSEWLKVNAGSASRRVPILPGIVAPIAKTTVPVSGPGAGQADNGAARLRASPGNRRAQSRHACRLGADVYRMGVAVPNRCSLTDISSGGCYVETSTPFPPGTSVEIIVRTHHMTLRTQGVVQTTHPSFGMGVQLILKTPEDHDQVQSLIRLLAQSTDDSHLGPILDPWTR
jgi:CheY-like chemotaxis protein